MAEVKNHAYQQAASMVKIQGILTIVFGGIGALFGLVLMAAFAIGLGTAYTDSDAFGLFLLFVLTVLFWVIPHVYLIIAGVTLLRLPSPRVAKILTIVNLVVGAFWNLVLLVFAIISLVQSTDYESGYTPQK